MIFLLVWGRQIFILHFFRKNLTKRKLTGMQTQSVGNMAICLVSPMPFEIVSCSMFAIISYKEALTISDRIDEISHLPHSYNIVKQLMLLIRKASSPDEKEA